MPYEVKLDQFAGPLEKLLELIEEKKMEITEVSLAAVTADFLDYLKSLDDIHKHPSVLADFVVVASKLLLIKSKALLPILELTEEEQKDIRDLEGRLKLYQEFKQASTHIQTLWDAQRSSYGREYLMNVPPVFYPPEDLALNQLETALQRILSELKLLIPEPHTVKKIMITIEEKVKELLERFKEKNSHSFHSLSQGRQKIEIIILFLATLHLMRDRIVQSEQQEQFSDIIIKRTDTNE
ncbi:MAG TPA: segregation/condensation protein A [Candidatus Paceibacterota bacterium]